MSSKDGSKKPSISEILSGRLDSLKGALKAGIPHDLIKPVRVSVTLKDPSIAVEGLEVERQRGRLITGRVAVACWGTRTMRRSGLPVSASTSR